MSTPIIHDDFETRSTVDLKQSTVDVYARDPNTDVWCMSFAFDDGEPELWTPDTNNDFLPDLFQIIKHGGLFYAHNAPFEWNIWNKLMVPRYGWPELPLEQCRCTMAMAYAMALPGSLENAAAAVGLTISKDMKGHKLMMQMAKPRSIDKKTGKIVWWDDDGRRKRLGEYCKQDTRTEQALCPRLRPLSEKEQKLWFLDQRINDRGVHIDVASVEKAKALASKTKDELDERMAQVTDGMVGKCSNVTELLDYVHFHGIETKGVTKQEVVDLLARDDLAEDLREALLLRQEAAKTSTAKLTRMVNGVSADHRVRGMLQFHGAGTGRWAGRKIQLQNMPRPKMPQSDIEQFIDDLDDIDLLEILWDKPLDCVSYSLRGMITAAPGNTLVAMDFSAIEARVLAWLAGEQKVLDVFRDHGKIYEHAAAGIYNKPMEMVDSEERQIGKVSVLALGYQGGVGAFQSMASVYGVKVEDDEADEIKCAWRDAHPKIVNFWYALDNAAKMAVQKPGRMFNAGKYIKFMKRGSFLWCQLPSKRLLCYPYPVIGACWTLQHKATNKIRFLFFNECSQSNVRSSERILMRNDSALIYKSVNGNTKKWELTPTYGGKLAENVTQAASRCLLSDSMMRVDEAGHDIIFHVHDEIVCEMPEEDGAQAHDEIKELMEIVPTWAQGLPIAAEGWYGKRYRK